MYLCCILVAAPGLGINLLYFGMSLIVCCFQFNVFVLYFGLHVFVCCFQVDVFALYFGGGSWPGDKSADQ